MLHKNERIEDIKTRKVFDNRGITSIEVEIITNNGFIGKASAP